LARTQYVVVLHQGEWKISLGGKHYGPYRTQREAIREAVDTARKEGQSNADGAQVLVQGEDNRFRTEWTYGKDPYPPPG
jgi:hypothetical protein